MIESILIDWIKQSHKTETSENFLTETVNKKLHVFFQSKSSE